jgi:hypothetical protein
MKLVCQFVVARRRNTENPQVLQYLHQSVLHPHHIFINNTMRYSQIFETKLGGFTVKPLHVEQGDVDEADLNRRGFLRGLGAAAAVAAVPGLAKAGGPSDENVEQVLKIASVVYAYRFQLGWTRRLAMQDIEQRSGLKGEALRVAGMLCDLAWSLPKDSYTKAEFLAKVKQELIGTRSATPQQPAPQKQEPQQPVSTGELTRIHIKGDRKVGDTITTKMGRKIQIVKN